MLILLDLNGWQKKVRLNNETAARVAKCGYVEIGLQKPLDIIAKATDIKIDSITNAMSLEFHHHGFWQDNLPIYKYVS